MFWLGEGAELPVEVNLWPDADLRIRVVDADGAPAAGVSVALVRSYDFKARRRVTASTTGGDGVALLRHASVAIHENTIGGAAPKATWHVPGVCFRLFV